MKRPLKAVAIFKQDKIVVTAIQQIDELTIELSNQKAVIALRDQEILKLKEELLALYRSQQR